MLTRDDTAGDEVQFMPVPLNYGPKEKFLARLEGNSDLDRPIAISLPRMSFELLPSGFRYDPSRKQSSVRKLTNCSATDPENRSFQFNPVPYDMEFNLHIMIKNIDDGTRIIEQILPFFSPEWTGTLNLDPDLGIKYDVPVILNSITGQDTYEGSFEVRRALVWTLNFTVKGYIFGPTKTAGLIKEVDVNLRVPKPGLDVKDSTPLNTKVNAAIVITPGLTANGLPTSNATLSIDKSLIKSTDNYGWITEITEDTSFL